MESRLHAGIFVSPYLFLCTYSCRECLLACFPTSPSAELANILFPCWIPSCSLPQPESLVRGRSVLISLMATADRLELMEYLRTVMVVFSVKQQMRPLISLSFSFPNFTRIIKAAWNNYYYKSASISSSLFCPVTFVLPLQDWRRRIAPQVQIRVFLRSLPLLRSWRQRASFALQCPERVSPQLPVLRLQLLDFVAHLHYDLRQAAGALHGAAAALPVPRLPKHRQLAVLLGFYHPAPTGVLSPALRPFFSRASFNLGSDLVLGRLCRLSPLIQLKGLRVDQPTAHIGCFINETRRPVSGKPSRGRKWNLRCRRAWMVDESPNQQETLTDFWSHSKYNNLTL